MNYEMFINIFFPVFIDFLSSGIILLILYFIVDDFNRKNYEVIKVKTLIN